MDAKDSTDAHPSEMIQCLRIPAMTTSIRLSLTNLVQESQPSTKSKSFEI